MKSAEAIWNYSLDVECPECYEYQDISRQNSEQDHPAGYVGDKPQELGIKKGNEHFVVECCNCKKEFCIKKVDY